MKESDPLIAASLAQLRKEYSKETLDEKDVERDPMRQFRA